VAGPAPIDVSVDAYYLGKCAEAVGNGELALAYFRRSVELADGVWETTRRQATLGAALRRHGDLDEALHVLQSSTALEPSHAGNCASWTALLALRRERSEIDESLRLGAELSPALADNPYFAAAYDEVLADAARRELGTVRTNGSRPAPHGDAERHFSAARGRIEAYHRMARKVNAHDSAAFEERAAALELGLKTLGRRRIEHAA
jgi:tetratricopeptide (TPR) repeat protein